ASMEEDEERVRGLMDPHLSHNRYLPRVLPFSCQRPGAGRGWTSDSSRFGRFDFTAVSIRDRYSGVPGVGLLDLFGGPNGNDVHDEPGAEVVRDVAVDPVGEHVHTIA